MKLKDYLILVAIVGGLGLMFFVTRFIQPERVKPGTPEYEAYIDRFVAECLRNPQPIEASANGRPPPSQSARAAAPRTPHPTEASATARPPPSQSEREAACRATVLQADRFNPDVRPLRQ